MRFGAIILEQSAEFRTKLNIDQFFCCFLNWKQPYYHKIKSSRNAIFTIISSFSVKSSTHHRH